MKINCLSHIVLSLLLVISAKSFSQNKEIITLHSGWTWISYTGANPMNLVEALANINDPSEGDVIKAPDERFATYSSLNGWSGSLMRLIPGMAYHYYSHAPGEISFVFPVPSTPTPPQGEVPTVMTGSIQNLLFRSAVCTGTVSTENRSGLVERGVCWGVNVNPTLANHHSGCGSEDGSFVARMNDLESNTTYYVRAYAYNENGIAYGDVVSFTTPDGRPSVSSLQIANVRANTATLTGTISDVGGNNVFARGICWSSNSNPTIDDAYSSTGAGGGDFVALMSGLSPSTTYYVRAYAVNIFGISYGDEVSLTTRDGIPDVITEITDAIRIPDAFIDGVILDDGGGNIIEQGVCYGINHAPDINGTHTIDSTHSESYSVRAVNLTVNTTYYARAYAITAQGMVYGNEVVFTTPDGIPSLSVEILHIESLFAISAGSVVDDGGTDIIERGVCWNINHNPTINDNHAAKGSGLGYYICDLDELDSNTTYYLRAYIINNQGEFYSEENEFQTEDEEIPLEGSINGLFTINEDGGQVYFSQGNLQYQASTNTWRFAEHQWEFVGGVSAYGTGEYGNVFVNGVKCDNANISFAYDGWIDLFGWGTSGYDHGANCYQPWSISANNEDYYAYGGEELSLGDQTRQADWGYNAISNGGNAENTWRTLTGGDNGEWEYILFSRETSSGIRFAKAVVNDVDGLVVVPDNWDNSNYELASPNDDMAAYSSNIIPLSVWDNVFETSGCVFLPSGGFRAGNMYEISISSVAILTIGLYWSSTYDLDARSIMILGSSIVSSRSDRGGGCAVRLVRDYVPSDQ